MEKELKYMPCLLGYEFMKWTIIGTYIKTSGEQVLELDADVNMEIKAKFKLITPTLSINVTPLLSGFIPIGIGERIKNGPHVIMAQPNEGFIFHKWEGAGIEDSHTHNNH